MSNKGSKDFEDPKMLFTVKLVNEQDFIRALLAEGQNTRAAKHIAVMLLSLNIADDEKDMIQLRKEFTPLNYHQERIEGIYGAYALISDFLNRTYFADYHRARPKYTEEGRL